MPPFPITARNRVKRMPERIELAAARVRNGPPLDDDADYPLPTRAGVLPLHLRPGPAIPDPRLGNGLRFRPASGDIGEQPAERVRLVTLALTPPRFDSSRQHAP